MKPELLVPSTLSQQQLAAWRRLAERAADPNPFFEPDFLLPAVRHLQSEGVGLLVSTDGDGEWRACLPVHRAWRWRRVPVPALASWLHLYCFLGTPLVDRDRTEAALASLLDGARSRRAPGVLGLSLLDAGGRVSAALEAAAGTAGARPIEYERYERAALRRGQPEPYVALSRKHEREVARMRRRLGEHLGGEVRTTDRAGDPTAVDDFLRLEAAGWKGETGTAFGSAPAHAAFLREICERFAEQGRLWLLSLAVGERVVAMKCNLLAGGTAFCFKIAYDEELARFSPGIQLEVDNVRAFEQSEDLELMDSCAMPNNQMINRLWSGRREISAVAVPLGGPIGWLAPVAVRASVRMRRGAAASPVSSS